MGSAGYEALAVLLGEADAYVHAGGQYEWDSAAGRRRSRGGSAHQTGATGRRCATTSPTRDCRT